LDSLKNIFFPLALAELLFLENNQSMTGATYYSGAQTTWPSKIKELPLSSEYHKQL